MGALNNFLKSTSKSLECVTKLPDVGVIWAYAFNPLTPGIFFQAKKPKFFTMALTDQLLSDADCHSILAEKGIKVSGGCPVICTTLFSGCVTKACILVK